MAIIYSYPKELNILPTDIVIGTTAKLVAGKAKNQTKSFSMEGIADFVIGSIPRGSLTTSSDANVTLTLGGVPVNSLFSNVSIEVGWNGLLADDRIASSGYWNDAYNSKINSATVTGGSSKLLTLTQQDGGTITASWEDGGDSIELTTIGTSGTATLIGSVLNIPNYSTSVSALNSTFVNTSISGTLSSPVITSSLSATGTPSSTTYLRGDNTWATIEGPYIWYLGGNIGTEPNIVPSGAVVNLYGGEMITTDHSGGNSDFLINHDSVTRIDTSSTASPAFGSTFTVIDSITSTSTGHVSAVNLKTVTLPTPPPTPASDVQNTVKAGVSINKGQAVYVTGADGTNIIVGLASNTSEATSSKTLGLLNANVVVNGFADVIQIGKLGGLNTIGANVGDPVWLGTNGNLIYGLANKPYAPAHLVYIGVVTRVNANNGEIFVTVQNGFELKEIHDVDLVTNVPVNGDVLGYDGTLWVNKTIAEWLGYTPVTSARTITINGVTQDLSADRSWTVGGGSGVSSFNTRTGAVTLSSPDVTSALGYTPYNSTNPAGYTSNTGTVTSVSGTGSVSGLTLSGTVNGSGSLTLGGTLSLTSGQVTGALGFTPYNATNPSGYITSSSLVWSNISGRPTNLSQFTNDLGNYGGWITGINSSMVTSALGYTPYNSSNPNGYITSSALSGYLPLTGGTVSGSITASGGFFNSDARLKDVISRDGDVAIFKWKDGRDDKTHIGYIAQEVQDILPDTVKEGEDGMLSVNYVEVLVAKIAELEKRIKQLEK